MAVYKAFALIFVLTVVQMSYGNKVNIHFTDDTVVDLETSFNPTTKDIIFTLTEDNDVKLRTSPFLDNVTWFSEDSAWMNKTSSGDKTKNYTFYFGKVLVDLAQNNTNSDTPCAAISETNEILCAFELYYDRLKPFKLEPIYLRIENKLESKPTIKILGGAYNNSKGYFYSKDTEYTKQTLENFRCYIQSESSEKYNQPMRDLLMDWRGDKQQEIINKARPALIHFRCPNFNKMALFEQDQALEYRSKINLAKFGLPFDHNYTCSFTLFLTEFYNNATLVPVKSSIDLPIRANPNFTEWALDFPEVTSIRYNYVQMQKEIKNLTEQIAFARFDAVMSVANLGLDISKRSNSSNVTVAKSFVLVSQNMNDLKIMIIVLFVIVGLLIIALLVQCFVILRIKQNTVETFHTAVEITGSSPYVKA